MQQTNILHAGNKRARPHPIFPIQDLSCREEENYTFKHQT